LKRACIITAHKNFPGGVETFNGYIENVLHQNGYLIDYCTSECERTTFFQWIFKLIFGRPGITLLKFRNIKYKYDLFIANGEYCFGISNEKCIVVFHGCLKGYGKAIRKWTKIRTKLSVWRGHLEQYWGAKGKYCIAVSLFAKNDLEKYGIRVHGIIKNCIDTALFVKNDNITRKGFLDVASYDYYRKGLDVLSKISVCLSEKEIYLVTNSNEKIENINILANTDNIMMPNIYNRYKIFIFPSRYEAMQLAPLEAMSCGVPVVISNVGLGPELMEEISDFVVDGYDEAAIEEYLQKIDKILKNYERYSQLARAYVLKHHSKELFYEKWSHVINMVESSNFKNFYE
jgi:glycosyltransferase involved in cell wall biosynthesis